MSEGPVRRCVACRTRRPQTDLVRIVAAPGGVRPVAEDRGRVPGRGAYVCGNRGCVEGALTSGALRRALRYDGPIRRDLGAELLEIAARNEERTKGNDG